MSLRLGIGSFTYPWAIGVPGHPPPRPLTASGLLERAAELGVGVVQFCDNLALDRLSPADLDDVCRRARELGLSLEVGTRGIGGELLRRYLDLAGRVASPIVRTVTDTADSQPSDDKIVSALRAVAPAYQRAGVSLAVENHGRHSSPRLIEILERIDSPAVGVCLDTANSLGALERPEETVAALAPWTVNVHVKDFIVGRMSHMFGYEITGCAAGSGLLDIPAVLDVVRAAGRHLSVIVELWPPPAGRLADTIAREERWAEESVGYLGSCLAFTSPT